MSALTNRLFIESLLKQVDWDKAPSVIHINYGKTECVYLKQSEGYYGIPRTTFVPKRKDGKSMDSPTYSSFGHMIYCRGENLGKVLPPITTNWLHEGRKKKGGVDKKSYHQYLFLALSTITQACIASQELDLDIKTLGEQLGRPWLSFHRGETTEGVDENIILQSIPEVGQEIIEFAEQTKLNVSVDMVKYLRAPERRLDPNHVLVEKGDWTVESTQQAKICRLPAGVISACKLKGVRLTPISTKERQSRSSRKKQGPKVVAASS